MSRPAPDRPPLDLDAPTWWEAFYADREPRWSGNPNALLVDEAGDLRPGTALDLGCGEGGDALWLAGRGWRVTAVDVAHAAIEMAAGHARAAGVDASITWERHDLGATFPAGSFDLVSACYLQSPVELPRETILRRAAAAVAPGGALVVAAHSGWPAWHPHPDPTVVFRSAVETLADLELDEDAWTVVRVDEIEREMTAPDGTARSRPDCVVHVRRAGG